MVNVELTVYGYSREGVLLTVQHINERSDLVAAVTDAISAGVEYFVPHDSRTGKQWAGGVWAPR